MFVFPFSSLFAGDDPLLSGFSEIGWEFELAVVLVEVWVISSLTKSQEIIGHFPSNRISGGTQACIDWSECVVYTGITEDIGKAWPSETNDVSCESFDAFLELISVNPGDIGIRVSLEELVSLSCTAWS